jgi:hypothetical protein
MPHLPIPPLPVFVLSFLVMSLAAWTLVVAIAFFLVADIDSPRRGVIRVVPQDLLALSESLRSP